VPVHPVTNIYGFDAAGQMTNKTVGGSPVSYAYDSARNMVRCQGVGFTNQYFYDHARRLVRVFSVFSGQTSSYSFVYDGMDVIAKVDPRLGGGTAPQPSRRRERCDAATFRYLR
jgi:hypothetical protein